jgi:predicted RNase H-like HicB family nuclease
MKYLIVIEQTATGLSAYSPDLPGCVATGATREEVTQQMSAVGTFHVEGLQLEGLAVPEAHATSAYVDIPA